MVPWVIEMTIEAPRFRIVHDPSNRRLWAYVPMDGFRELPAVGGFKSPKDARRAFERASKAPARGD